MTRCPRCGAPASTRAVTQPLCPGCLIASVLAADPDRNGATQQDATFDIPYHIITLIGGDADVVTYLARTAAAATLVALTIVGPRQDAPAIIARAELHGAALREVRDSHIARLLDAGAAADRCVYLAEEFVGGPSLAMPACRDQLTAGDRQTVITQLGAAVATLHRQGVTHLSLDPSRVKIGVRDGVHATLIGLGFGLIVDGLAADPQQDLDALASLARGLDVNR